MAVVVGPWLSAPIPAACDSWVMRHHTATCTPGASTRKGGLQLCRCGRWRRQTCRRRPSLVLGRPSAVLTLPHRQHHDPPALVATLAHMASHGSSTTASRPRLRALPAPGACTVRVGKLALARRRGRGPTLTPMMTRKMTPALARTLPLLAAAQVVVGMQVVVDQAKGASHSSWHGGSALCARRQRRRIFSPWAPRRCG